MTEKNSTPQGKESSAAAAERAARETCGHARTQLVAKDQDAEYIECLDCGAILESAEMPGAQPAEGKEAAGKPDRSDAGGTDGSLSDA